MGINGDPTVISKTIPRDGLADEVLEKAARQPHTLLYGPAHWGKSWLLREAVAPRAIERFPSCVYLDFYALRHPYPGPLEREATRWLFAGDEMAFQKFRGEAPDDGLLFRLLDSRLPRGGLLLLDHVERLTDAPEISAWLSKLANHASECGWFVIWGERCVGRRGSRLRHLRAAIAEFEMPLLGQPEIRAWLSQPALKGLRASGVTARSVQRVTGGAVGLLRDLAVFLKELNYIGQLSLDRFVTYQTQRYSPSCQKVLDALLDYPSEIGKWRQQPSPPLANRLWLSGVFRRDPHGRLHIASPIHRTRLPLVAGREQVLLTNSSQAWKMSGPPLEVQTRSLARCIADRDGFDSSLQVLGDFFRVQGWMAQIFLPDPDHPLVWQEVCLGSSSRRIRVKASMKLNRGVSAHIPFLTVLRGVRRYPELPEPNEACHYPLVGRSGRRIQVTSAPRRASAKTS